MMIGTPECDLPPTPMKSVSPRSRWLRDLDLVVLALGAPAALLAGAPVLGYGIGAAAWILLRAVGVATDARALARANVAEQILVMLGYRLMRAALLIGAALVALAAGTRNDGVTAVVVVVVAFSVRLALSSVADAS
jgi:hypothetical protein